MPILLLTVAVVGFVVLTNPLYAEIQVLRQEEASYGNALANSLKLQELRDVLIDKQNQFTQRDIESLEKMIPSSVDNIKLAIELQQIGEAEGLSVESVQYDPVGGSSDTDVEALGASAQTLYEVFELEIIARGEYTQFVEFLKEVERNLRIVDVSHVEFSSDGTFLNENEYTYNITIKTYRLRD
jgi:Tfp pilus assembly protein PilO